MRCDTDENQQFIVALRNVDLAVIGHPYFASQVDESEQPASGGGGDHIFILSPLNFAQVADRKKGGVHHFERRICVLSSYQLMSVLLAIFPFIENLQRQEDHLYVKKEDMVSRHHY